MKDHIELPYEETSLAVTAATGVLVDLESIWTKLLKLGTSEDFMVYMEPMIEMPDASGDAMARILDRLMAAPADELARLLKEAWPDLAAPDGKLLPPDVAKIRVIELGMLDVACLFVVQAVRADVDKASPKEQWELACEARRRLGMLQGYILGTRERTGISTLAKLGADALHKENRAMRQQAYEWLAENLERFKSSPDAAEALKDIVPMQFSTRLDYVKAFKKAMKSKSE